MRDRAGVWPRDSRLGALGWWLAAWLIIAPCLVSGAAPEKRKSGVRMPLSEFLKLLPTPEPAPAKPPPYQAGLSSGQVTVTVEPAAAGRSAAAHGTARYALAVPGGDWHRLPVLGTAAALTSVTVDGQPATVTADGPWYRLLVNAPGTHLLEVAFTVPVTIEKGVGRLALPLAPAAGTALAVSVPGDQRVTVAPSAGVAHTHPDGRTEAETVLPAAPDHTAQRGVTVTWEAAVPEMEAPAVKVYAEVHRLAAVADRRLRVLALCRYSILHAGLDRFAVTVPGDVEVVRVVGEGVARWETERADGRQRVMVRLEYPVRDSYALALELERGIAADQDQVPAPTVIAEGVERQSGDVAVEAWTSAELSWADGAAGAIDPQDVPRSVRDAATTPIILACRPKSPTDRVVVGIRRLAAEEGLEAIIDVADFETTVTRDGRRLTRVIYAVRNRGAQFLRVQLPEGARVWSAAVAGQAVKPARDDRGGVLFPLAMPTARRRALEMFPVTFVCFQVGTPLDATKSAPLRVDLPTTAVPARYATFYLHVPEGVRVEAERFAGTLDHRQVLFQETEALVRQGRATGARVQASEDAAFVGGLAELRPMGVPILGEVPMIRRLFEEAGVDPNQTRTEVVRQWARAYGKGGAEAEAYQQMMTEIVDTGVAGYDVTGVTGGPQTDLDRQRLIQEAAQSERASRSQFDELRREKVDQLVAQAGEYVKRREYDLGFQTAEEALKLDPANVEARIIRDQAQMWGMQVRSEELRHKRDLEIQKMIIDVEETRIPSSAVVTYPEDWAELSARRKRYDVMRLGQPETPAVARVRQQLAKPVTIEFPNTPFENVIDFLQDLTGVSIVTDRKALNTEGITPETTIKLKLNNVPLEDALSLVLEQVNLDYTITDEAIFITNAEGIGKDLGVRVYDVRDLVVAMGSWRGETWGANGGNGTWSDEDADEPPFTAAERRVGGQLQRRASVDFPGTSAENVIDFMRNLTGVNIVVDPRAAGAQGLAPGRVIRLQRDNAPVYEVLREALDQVALTCVVRDGVLYVTEPERAAALLRQARIARERYRVPFAPITPPPPQPAATMDVDLPATGALYKFERFLITGGPLYVEAPYRVEKRKEQ